MGNRITGADESAFRRHGQVETCYAAADDATGTVNLLSVCDLARFESFVQNLDAGGELKISRTYLKFG